MKDKALMTDSELIQLVRAADPSGLSFVYEKYRKEYLSWIRKFSHCQEEEAREYYQASILILYENIMTGKLGELQSSLKTYLFGIGKNLALQGYRKAVKLQRAKAEYLLERHLEVESGGVRQEEMNLNLVSSCLSQLGDACRQLLDLFYFHQKKMEEITAELGYKNTETTKNQKYKCMERLRKMVIDGKTKENDPLTQTSGLN